MKAKCAGIWENHLEYKPCNTHHMTQLTSENKVLISIRKNEMGDNGLKSQNLQIKQW